MAGKFGVKVNWMPEVLSRLLCHLSGVISMLKVLVVDDTKNIRNLLTTCLEIEGYKVFCAENGQEVLNLLRHEEFDLIFLDIKLPGISGTEVFRRIREMGNNVPVIIMTAFATVRNAVECTRLGAVAYLQKPFTAEKVRHTLSEIQGSIQNNSGNIDDLLAESRELINGHKLDEAFEQLKHALAMDPSCARTYQLLAQLYEAQGNNREAELFQTIARQYQ
jgi:DNA-binding response OmpR family regulator